jgi:hypothetical protein
MNNPLRFVLNNSNFLIINQLIEDSVAIDRGRAQGWNNDDNIILLSCIFPNFDPYFQEMGTLGGSSNPCLLIFRVIILRGMAGASDSKGGKWPFIQNRFKTP